MTKPQRGYRRSARASGASALTPRTGEHTVAQSDILDLGSDSVERYPMPSYAAGIWWTADGLRLSLPAGPDEQGHSVILPLKDKSLFVLADILRERSRFAERQIRAAIGTKAAPVAYDIEQILLGLGKKTARVDHRTTLGDLGLED